MNNDNNDQLLILIKNLNDKIAELKKSKDERHQPIINILDSEQNFKALVESARDGIAIIQNDVIKFANQHVIKMYGKPLSEVVGQSFLKFVHTDNIDIIKKRYADWRNGKKVPNNFEVNLINAAEEKRICEINSSTIVFDGQPSELVFIHDITERKQAVEKLNVTNQQLVASEQKLRAANQQLIADEEELKESEYQLKESQEIAGLGTYLLDISTGIWKSSSILDNIFGINKKYKKDLAGWFQIVHPEDKEIMQDYFATNVLKNHELFNKEYRIKRINDQQEYWVHGIGKLEINDDGDPIKLVGTIQDITKRKKAEKKLQESEEKYRLLVDNTDTGFVVVDDKGIVVEANDPYLRLVGAEKQDDVIGRSVIEWTAPESKEENEAAVALTAKQGYVKDFETTYLRNDGTRVIILINAIMHETSEGKRLSAQCRDITERKQAEEKLISRNKELEMFHEVTVGRELKMIKLKKEINELLEKSGEKPKYKIPT